MNIYCHCCSKVVKDVTLLGHIEKHHQIWYIQIKKDEEKRVKRLDGIYK